MKKTYYFDAHDVPIVKSFREILNKAYNWVINKQRNFHISF